MLFTVPVSFLTLAVGVTSAAIKAENPNAAQFQMWNWDCGAQDAHTWGTVIPTREHTNLCLPLAEDTRALDVQVIDEGCRITAYMDPLCDDYPENGSYIEKTGCLWTHRTYKSYKLTCQ
ncbi:hypothetical protein F5Y05DRAFT_419586 [Hypoxylon sp. FL0543]|nr:hypothetical protein F5Y05DRAFT_419586 [Hypoxylon sp. FL0543]